MNKEKLNRMKAAAPMLFSLLTQFYEWSYDVTVEDDDTCTTQNWLNQQVETLTNMINFGFENENLDEQQEE